MKNTTYLQFRKSFDDAKSLEEKIELLWAFTEVYWDSFRTELSELMEHEVSVCIKQKHLGGETLFRVLLSRIYADTMQMEKAMFNVNFVRENINNVSDKVIVAYCKVFLSIMEIYFGNYDAAFNMVVEATNDYKGFENHQNYGWCPYSMAIIYMDLKDFDNAELKFNEALQHFIKTDYPYGIARCETGLGTLKMRQKKNDEAEILLLKSLDVFEKLEVSSGSSRVNNDLGELYKKKGDKELSMKYLRRAVEIRRETEHWQGLATSLIELGDLMLETNNEQEAINFLNEAIEICTKINNRFKLSRANQLMYQLYRKKKESDKAIIYLEEYHRLKDEVSNAESANKIKAMEKKAATEKAEKEAEIERIRNVEMKLAFDIIEEKNKEILDSINYARRIQYTLLASDEVLKKYLPEHFVLFQPKDIVSGDFYWFSHGENDDTFYLAVCDSTGHGVPGAFMSLLNITYLNEAINEKKIAEPGKILDYVREKLIKNVSQDGAKDGMDATLLKFEVGSSISKVTYAAAHNCPFLVRNGELIEMPFDKMPVGMDEYKHPFTTHHLPAKKGDLIYLGTDGYADQFGGEKFGVKKAGGKKFKKSNLKKLLVEIANSKLETQNSKLQTAFTDWKGDLEQVDDVCIIGIRI